MEYIYRMREKIGHERVLIPATAIVILDSAGRVCLHLRNESGVWGLPGGLMDIGETLEESAVREVQEETGLHVSGLKIYGTFSGPKFHTEYPGGDQTAPMIVGFYTEAYEGALKGGEESLDVRFFSLAALPKNMNQYHRWFVEGFLEFRKTGEIVLS